MQNNGLEYGSSTDIGLDRDQNQDAVYVSFDDPSPANKGAAAVLFAVADGMGGHRGGGLASRMACDLLSAFFPQKVVLAHDSSVADMSRRLAQLFYRIDRQIRLTASTHNDLAHMGTTLSCLLLSGSHAIVAHVGDSRIYRLRQDHLTCMTVDHTFVQDMIFEGEVDPAHADEHPLRHMLTRAVGTGEPLEWVDTRVEKLLPNDRFLLCTDGLYHSVETFHISKMMARGSDPGNAAKALVDQALEGQSKDNVTAVVVHVNHFPAPAPEKRP